MIHSANYYPNSDTETRFADKTRPPPEYRDSGYFSSPPLSPAYDYKGADEQDSKRSSTNRTKCEMSETDSGLPVNMEKRESLLKITFPNRVQRFNSSEKNVDETDQILDMATFTGSFTHEEGGILRKPGSDVILRIPPGAVPAGKTYTIHGKIHTDLSTYNQWMKSPYEIIIGPVPQYWVEGGGTFEKPVEVEIPHCLTPEKAKAIRVQYSQQDGCFKEVSHQEKQIISYVIKDHVVVISSTHFTRFICSAEAGEEEEITDALLTVASSVTDIPGHKQIIKIRLMLHSRCAGQNDFGSERSQFYDPDMEEIKRMKVELPERGPLPYPKINLELVIDDDCGWTNRLMNGRELHPLIQKKDGQDVLAPRTSQARHRSEQLADYIVELTETECETDHPFNGHIEAEFYYNEKIIKHHMLELTIPVAQPPFRLAASPPKPMLSELLSLENDALSKVIKEISRDIGEDFKRLGIYLGIPDQDITEISRKHYSHFERSYSLLQVWRQSLGTLASLEELLKALERCQRVDLVDSAKSVAKRHKESPSPWSSPVFQRRRPSQPLLQLSSPGRSQVFPGLEINLGRRGSLPIVGSLSSMRSDTDSETEFPLL